MLKLDIQMFAGDAKIIIGTEIDNTGLEKGLDTIAQKLNASGKKVNTDELKNEFVGMINEVEDKMEELNPYIEEYSEKMAEYTELTSKGKGSLIFESDKIEAEQLKREIKEIVSNIEKLTGEKITIAGFEEVKKNAKEINKEINKSGFSLKRVISRVVRWGLALLGIRSIFQILREAMSSLSRENEQIATDIEYMKWIISQTLKPVIEWVIKGLYLILTLVNMVSVALFRYNFLAEKSADQFKKMKKSTGGIASDLKEARKQLASFDEMNILGDNVKASGGGGGISSGIDEWEMPNFSTMEQKIKNFIDKWRQFGEEMKQSLYKMPFSKWTDAFGDWDLAIYGVTETVHGLWGMITNMIGFVVGVVQIVHGLITGNNEEVKKGIETTIKSIIGWISSTVEVIRGIGDIIKGIIKGILMTIWGWLFDGIDRATQRFNEFRDKVVGTFSYIATKIKTKITEIQNFLTEKFGFFGTVIGTVIGGAFKGAVNFALASIERILNTPITAINGLIMQVSKLGIKITPLKTFKFPRLAKGTILNNPGQGVPVAGGRAIAGEAGREAYLPLSDSQLLEELGSTIGKYITVNLTNVTDIDGRTIARKVTEINNNNDFLLNR